MAQQVLKDRNHNTIEYIDTDSSGKETIIDKITTQKGIKTQKLMLQGKEITILLNTEIF
ncbi:MAG: hypothetical protein WCK82_12350 [Bacteroidota bacterium]|jgi:hypothetical protein